MKPYRDIKNRRGYAITVICLLWAATAGAQSGMVSFQPVDTGRSVSFHIDRGDNHTRDRLSIKTNLLYAATMTPNLALEVGLSRKFTVEIAAGYNGWGNFWAFTVSDPDVAKRQLDHILGKVEGRWWFRGRFDGHFLGANVFYTDYKINGVNVPLLFEKDYRFDGYAVGLGASWGYLWRWNDSLGMEFNLGAGVMFMKYDKYLCTTDCSGSAEVRRWQKTYFGPTSAGIKLFFMIK